MDADDALEGNDLRLTPDCLDDGLLEALVRGGLDKAAKQAAFKHLAACRICEARLTRAEARHPGGSHFDAPLPKPGASTEWFAKKRREQSFPDLGPAAAGHPNDLGTFAGGRYRVLGWIDSGGTAHVFKAYDTKMDGLVALKVLREQKGEEAPNKRGKKRSAARSHFEQEARSGFKLRASNDRLVGVIGSDTEHKPPYLVMDYVEGESLSTRVRDAGEKGLPVDEAKRIIREVAKGLALVHKQGWVHQDIKPQNILLPANGPPKIIDVGLAFEVGGARALPRGCTPEYASPEQLSGGKVGPASDVYNLGATLYELLTGKLLTTCEEHKAFVDFRVESESGTIKTDPLSRAPKALRAICRKCLRAKPSERYASAQDVVEAIEAIGRRRRTALKVAAVLIPLVAFAGGAYGQYDKLNERQRAEAAERHALQLRAEDEKNCNELEQVHGEFADLILAERRQVPADSRRLPEGAARITNQQSGKRKEQIITRLRELVTALKGRELENPKLARPIRLAEAALAEAENKHDRVLALLPRDEVDDLTADAVAASQAAFQANFLRATALLATEQYPEALATYRRSLAVKPNDPKCIALIGYCLFKLGRDGDYATDINPLIAYFEAKKGQPATYGESVRWLAELYSLRAGWHYKGARYTQALEDIDRAIEVEKLLRQRRIEPVYSPGLCTIYANRANLLVELGRDEEALEAERAALEESLNAFWSTPVDAFGILAQSCRVLDQISTRGFGTVRGRAVAARIFASTLMAITGAQAGLSEVADRESEEAAALADKYPSREHPGIYCLAYVVRMQVTRFLCARERLQERIKKVGSLLPVLKQPATAAGHALRYASEAGPLKESEPYLKLAVYFLHAAKLDEDYSPRGGSLVNKAKLSSTLPTPVMVRVVQSTVRPIHASGLVFDRRDDVARAELRATVNDCEMLIREYHLIEMLDPLEDARRMLGEPVAVGPKH